MGVDTNIWLRIRDRGALREALESYAARERASWVETGREAEYEELRGDGYDPFPLMHPLRDGSVSIFTGLRFHDGDGDYALRCWIHEYFGPLFSRIHDDPRGVFVTPDVCEPRAHTYDGVVKELARAGRWIDPKPPTQAEADERERRLIEYSEGMDVLRAAHEQGEDALAAALARVPGHVRDAWNEQYAQHRRMMQMMSVTSAVDETGAKIALEPNPQMIVQFEAMFAGALRAMTEETSDARGHGRISAAVPKAIRELLDANPRGHFDVDEAIPLRDGSALVVTTRLGRDDEAFMAQNLAQVVEEAGLDRRSFGALPFFRESLVAECRNAPDLATVVERLGERAKLLTLETFEEAYRRERASANDWLRDGAD